MTLIKELEILNYAWVKENMPEEVLEHLKNIYPDSETTIEDIKAHFEQMDAEVAQAKIALGMYK